MPGSFLANFSFGQVTWKISVNMSTQFHLVASDSKYSSYVDLLKHASNYQSGMAPLETQKDYCDSDKSTHPDRNATQGEAIELVLGTSANNNQGTPETHALLGMSTDV